MEFELDKWDEILGLMLTAVFELSQQAARVMERQGGGKIINIASLVQFPGGMDHSGLRGRQTRHRRSDQGPGQRVGGQKHPRQRPRSGLL